MSFKALLDLRLFRALHHLFYDFPAGSLVKESTCSARELQETWVQPLGREDPLVEQMATHSSILAWEIP